MHSFMHEHRYGRILRAYMPCLPSARTGGPLPRCCEDSHHVCFPSCVLLLLYSLFLLHCAPSRRNGLGVSPRGLVFAFGNAIRCWVRKTWELGTNERPLRLGSGQGLGHAHLQYPRSQVRMMDAAGVYCCSAACLFLCLASHRHPTLPPCPPPFPRSPSASSSRVLRNCLPFFLPVYPPCPDYLVPSFGLCTGVFYGASPVARQSSIFESVPVVYRQVYLLGVSAAGKKNRCTSPLVR